MNRIVALVALLAIFAAACGVERTSDDTLSGDDVSSETSADDEGSEDADGEDDASGSPTTTAPSPTPAPVPTTGVPAEVVLAADLGGADWEITHGELNDVVVPTQENEEFVQLVFGGAQPPGFTAGVLTEHLVSEALQVELAAAGGSVTEENLADSKVALLSQVETLYPTSEDPAADAERLFDEVPYLGFLVEYQATQDALSDLLAAEAAPGVGNPCVRHILVESEGEAQDILTRLDGGEDFGELAVELSTGPSGPTGGELGCADSSGYVPPFAEAVDSAEVGAFVGPVETTFGWHVLVVDRFEVDGRALASDLLRNRLTEASVDVDAAVGSWDTDRLAVVPIGQ